MSQLTLPQTIQLEELKSQYAVLRGRARALGVERSFAEHVYKNITGFGKLSDHEAKTSNPTESA